jgi:flagellar biosynthesis anti-sigma factor FlgM
MRINDPNSLGNALPPESAATEPASRTVLNAPGTITVGPDRADLSEVAGRLSEILQSESGSRAQKIQQLKEAVASGTYQVDSAALSRALLNEALTPGAGNNTNEG